MSTKNRDRPFSRLSRIATGGRKSSNARAKPTEDHWYIPYNGPYEPPKQQYQQHEKRDSWGDPVFDEDVLMIGGSELHSRYESLEPSRSEWSIENDDRHSTLRKRAMSGASGRTVSSGNIDPSHTYRRSTYSSGTNRPQIPSYVNLDAVGGVGASPVPPPHKPVTTRESSTNIRSSFSNIFSVMSSKRLSNPSTPTRSKGTRSAHGRTEVEDEDYYNSYYTTLVDTPAHKSDEKNFEDGSPLTDKAHPYTYAFPSISQNNTPPTSHSAPPERQTPTRLDLTDISTHAANPPRLKLQAPLKSSTSTPNLRKKGGSTGFPRGKDRWLSAETWCDAILFPRPRFKIKEDGSSPYGPRIISPPGSPVVPSSAAHGIVSRVLAQSRSMVDLHAPKQLIEEPPVPGPSRLPIPRPKSFAQDDLALPSPIPSLSRVLEEGQILEHQRKKWQMQAQTSFQNSRARNLARARSKSLNLKQTKRHDHPVKSNIDFLAARSLVGNQSVIPVATINSTSSHSKSDTSKGSHSHSNSLSKTASKSSKSYSNTGHSRNDSWSKSAFRVAKGICGFDGSSIIVTPPPEDKTPEGLESAIRSEGTRIIKLADPAEMICSPSTLSNRLSPSPTGDVYMGIVLTTPPVSDESAGTFDRESIRMTGHPYAQGGMYSVTTIKAGDKKSTGASYAGPHPSTTPNPDAFGEYNAASRHRLPPQATHPYAQVNNRDSYQSEIKVIPRIRADSNVPLPEKMWALYSPGFASEILPAELRYSPYISSPNTPIGDQVDGRPESTVILDTIGVGEALAYATLSSKRSKDSGLGTSEEFTGHSDFGSSHPHRTPVQYDITKNSYHQLLHTPTAPLVPRHLGRSATLTTIMSGDGGLTPPSRSPANGNSEDSSPSGSSALPSPNSHSTDDLERFKDLFYRPTFSAEAGIPPSISAVGVDQRSPTRTGSGLTSIVRQLTQDMQDDNDIRAALVPESLDSVEQRETPERGLHFVVSDNLDHDAASLVDAGNDYLAMAQPTNIPEDITPSRASSPTSPGQDRENELLRLGEVEPLSTPPAISGLHRRSFSGQLDYAIMMASDDSQVIDIPARHSQYLQPSADPTRSSYLTSSDASRMSGLSDFPIPPPRSAPAHLSLSTSYFDDSPEGRMDPFASNASHAANTSI